MPHRPPIHNPIPVRPRGARASPARSDGFYRSAAWQELRAIVLARDHYQCRLKLPGCYGLANTADHIIERAKGGADQLANLRAACAGCHNKRHAEKGRARDV